MASFRSNSGPQELRVGSFIVQVKERLAEGGFGFVDLVYDVHTKKDLVLKRCNVDRAESMETVKKEISILQRFASPYMVELLASDIIQKNKQSREALLLMEYYSGGHLLDRLNARNGQFLPAESLLRIFGQILLSLKPLHFHNPPVTHRDLKLENILFDGDGKVRLCDFGSCIEGYVYIRNAEERQAAEEVISKETTQMYRAPELVDLYMRDVLTEKSDIWALGCILFALAFLHHPFQNAGSLGILSAKVQFPTSSPLSPDGHTLIQRMLDVDPEARPDINYLFSAVKALSSERPLPPFELSEEAQRRRQERLAASDLRAKKAAAAAAAKKAHFALPSSPKAVPLSSTSVAAKRLAALRGVPTSDDSSPSFAATNSNSEVINKTDFDPFSFEQEAEFSFQPTFSPSTFAQKDQNPPSFAGFDAFSDDRNDDPFSPSSSSARIAPFTAAKAAPPVPSTASAVFESSWVTSPAEPEPSAISSFDAFQPTLPEEVDSVAVGRNLKTSFDLLDLGGRSSPVPVPVPAPTDSEDLLSLAFDEQLPAVANSAGNNHRNVSSLLDLDLSESSFAGTSSATSRKKKHEDVLSLFDRGQLPVPPPSPAMPHQPTGPANPLVSPRINLQSFSSSVPLTPTPIGSMGYQSGQLKEQRFNTVIPPRPNLPLPSPAMQLTLENSRFGSGGQVGGMGMGIGMGMGMVQPGLGTAERSGGPVKINHSHISSNKVSVNVRSDPFDNLNLFPMK